MHILQNILKYISLFAIISLLNFCSSNSTFQQHDPTSKTTLSDLLAEVPAIHGAFSNLDIYEFNDTLADFLNHDIPTSIFILDRLSNVMHGDAHLPLLIDDISGILHKVFTYYSNPDNASKINQLSNVFHIEGELDLFRIVYLTAVILGKTTSSLGQEDLLFSNNLPARVQWENCSIFKDNYINSVPQTNDYNENQTLIWQMSLMGRGLFCELYDQQKLTMQNFLAGVKDADLEYWVNLVIQFLETANLNAIDENIAQWLTPSTAKYDLIQYTLNPVYPFLTSNDGHSPAFKNLLLEKTLPYLLKENPDASSSHDTLLIQPILHNIHSDINKLKDLKSYVHIPTNHYLYSFIQDDLLADVKEVFADAGYSRSRLKNLLWDGWEQETFYSSQTPASDNNEFEGLLHPNSGLRTLSSGVITEHHQPSEFRNSIQDKMNSIFGETYFSTSMYNEKPFEAFLKDIYYHVVNDYYTSDNGWLWDEEDSIQAGRIDPYNGFKKERNLKNYIAKLQYALQNLSLLNRNAEYPDESTVNERYTRSVNPLPTHAGSTSESEHAYFTAFFHVLAGGSGKLDPYYGPLIQTLQTGMRASNNVDIAGDKPQVNSNTSVSYAGDGNQYATDQGKTIYTAVACWPGITIPQSSDLGSNTVYTCDALRNRMFRNGVPYVIHRDMPSYEMITPGLFFERNAGGTEEGEFHTNVERYSHLLNGNYTQHQGDLISTQGQTTNYILDHFKTYAIEGYSPYTVRGKAPNGSKLKYENDYYTDSYKARICNVGEHRTWDLVRGVPNATRHLVNSAPWIREVSRGLHNNGYTCVGGYLISSSDVPLGSNAGKTRTRVDATTAAKEGVLHMYENIYRPMKPSDPCWSNAEPDSTNSYTKYGYLRPSKSNTYHNNALCSTWQRIQVDFDSREKAMAEGLNWVINYKKFVLLTPNAVFSNVMGLVSQYFGTSMALFNITVGNGLSGLISTKLPQATNGSSKQCNNGRWNLDPNHNMMEANCEGGMIPNVSEGHTGADSCGFIRESTVPTGVGISTRFGCTSFEPSDSSFVIDITYNAWGPAIHPPVASTEAEITKKIFDGVARPKINFLENLSPMTSLSKPYNATDILTNLNQQFVSDIRKFKKFLDRYYPFDGYNSEGTPGADGIPDLLQKYERSLNFPNCKNASNQKVRFCITAKELPYIPKVKNVTYPVGYNSNGNPNNWYAYSMVSERKLEGFVSVLMQMIETFDKGGEVVDCNQKTIQNQASLDNLCILYFKNNGSRSNIKQLLESFTGLNETILSQSHDLDAYPVYNPKSLINLLVEKSENARDGLLAKFFGFFNISNTSSLVEEIKIFLSDIFESTLRAFDTTNDQIQEGKSLSNLDKLRYFLTNNVVNEGIFSTNHISGTESPLVVINEWLNLLRDITASSDNRQILTSFIQKLNTVLAEEGKNISIPENIVDILHVQSSLDPNKYALDTFIEYLIQNNFLDLKNLYNLDEATLFSSDTHDFATVFADFADVLKEYIDIDLYSLVLSHVLGDTICSSSTFNDLNNNGIQDAKWFILDQNLFNANCQTNSKYYFDIKYYQVNINDIAQNFNNALNSIVEDDINSILDFLYDDLNLNFIQEFKDIAIDTLYDYQFLELATDINGNGIIEDTEYTDVNNNEIRDEVSVREFIDYISNKLDSTLYTVITEGDQTTVKITPNLEISLLTANDILNQYNNNCNLHGLDDINCNYIGNDLFNMYAGLQEQVFPEFTQDNLKALYNLSSQIMYDAENQESTYFLSNTAEHLIPILNQLRGRYSGMVGMLSNGFKPEGGFFTFMFENLKIPAEYNYNTMDLFRDLNILLNTKVMRKYKTPNTFWWQLGELMKGFSGYAYVTQKRGFDSNLNQRYYQSAQKIFK